MVGPSWENGHVIIPANGIWSTEYGSWFVDYLRSVVLPNNQLMISGGKDGFSEAPIDTVVVVDPESKSIKKLQGLPIPLLNHCQILLNSTTVFIIGGQTLSEGRYSSV